MALPDNYGQAVPEPLPLGEQQKISPDTWDNDEYALKLVRSDWAHAESYRTNAHDWRFRNADELYLAWAGQQYWDGSRVPRSSLGIHVIFEQVEAMLPKMVSALAGVDNYHFQPEQPGGPEVDLAVLAWREMVLKQLAEARWREQLRRACKSIAIYGNGVIEVGMEDYEEEFISFRKSSTPTRMHVLYHPVAGPLQLPSGMSESFSRKIQKEQRKRPYIRYISIKDFYVDPNSESTCLQDAGFCIKRTYMRAEEVKALKGRKGFNIPDDQYLTNISKAKATSNQDVTKLSAELFRYNMWNPSQDYTSDPSQKRIAVVEYTKKNRKVWWLQGGEDAKSIIYNQPNPYGQINFFSSQYADVLDRWHAQSVSDVAEPEQRLQQAIINARVDELALALHPPTIKRRGVTVPWYQLKRRPGAVVEVENPADDIKEAEIKNITQNAFVEVSMSENRVQKITGVTDLAALGTPASGGNSANRTAAGINTQAGATQSRMQYLVENIEDSLVDPVVNFVIKLNRKFMDPKQASNWLKLDPRFSKLDPEAVMNTRVTADCKASGKMAARQGFLQLFPQLAQIIFNPEMIQLLSQQNQETPNTKGILQAVTDALNYTPREPWFVPMSQQQIQAMNQPKAEDMIKMQQQQMQIQSDENINQRNLQTKLIDTLLKVGFQTHAQHADADDQLLMHATGLQHEAEQNQLDRDSAEKQAKDQAAAAKAQAKNGPKKPSK